jgi:hypothetical protein
MARVVNFFELEIDEPRLHPTEVDCGVKRFTIGDEAFVQLSTFGSTNRKGNGVSQTLQLDLSAAKRLMQAPQAAFPELA